MVSIELTLKDGGTLHANPYTVMHVVDGGPAPGLERHCTVVPAGGERYAVLGSGEEIAGKILSIEENALNILCGRNG